MFTDWALASLHHLAIFTLAAILAAELAILTMDIDAKAMGRLARIDMGYGISAGIVVVVGVARVIWGAKGYEYYVANHIFWTKACCRFRRRLPISPGAGNRAPMRRSGRPLPK
jgi:putative membrane protein